MDIIGHHNHVCNVNKSLEDIAHAQAIRDAHQLLVIVDTIIQGIIY